MAMLSGKSRKLERVTNGTVWRVAGLPMVNNNYICGPGIIIAAVHANCECNPAG